MGRPPVDLDLIVVGAGPAGAAAALAALGVDPTSRVLLLDRAVFPRDKPCGDGVSAAGVGVLEELGVSHVLTGAVQVDQVAVTGPTGTTATADLGRPGRVLPRLILDERLVAAAVERGAQLAHHRVREVAHVAGGVEVDGRWRAPVVVAADGANSRIRHQLGHPVPARHTALALRAYAPQTGPAHRLTFVFPPDPWPAYAWSFPVGGGRRNVGFGVFDTSTGVDRLALEAGLRRWVGHGQAEPGSLRAHPLPLTPGRPAPAYGRVLLAGDAAGLVNPLTGEGIHTALLSGAVAGRAAITCPDAPAAAYRAWLGQRLDRHLRHDRVLAAAFAHRSAVELSVDVARRSPGVLDDIAELALGTGTITPRMVRSLLPALVRHELRRGLAWRA